MKLTNTSHVDNDITRENMVELNDALLKELIPSVGKRIDFKHKLDEFKVNKYTFYQNKINV